MERPGHAKLRVTMTSRAYRLLLLHPIRLIKRLLAEHASPRSLAVAAGLGILVGATPFLGLHTFLVYVLASRFRLNRLMALGTNQLCTPPFIPAFCIETGYYLRHGTFLTEVSIRTLGHEALQRFWEWLLGAFVLGPVLAVVAGGIVWVLAWRVQRREPPGGFVSAEESEKATPAGQP